MHYSVWQLLSTKAEGYPNIDKLARLATAMRHNRELEIMPRLEQSKQDWADRTDYVDEFGGHLVGRRSASTL